MKTGIKYGVIFLIIHIVLSVVAITFFYDPTIPNGDLGMLIFPNIVLLLPLSDILPDIFGEMGILYWNGIIWFFIGMLIGRLVEKRRTKKLNSALNRF